MAAHETTADQRTIHRRSRLDRLIRTGTTRTTGSTRHSRTTGSARIGSVPVLLRIVATAAGVVALTLGAAAVPAEAAALTVVKGDIIVTQSGTVIDSKDVHGRILVRATNVTIKNSIIRGLDSGASKYGLIDATQGKAGLVVSNTEITAIKPNPYVNGIMGYNFTLSNVKIHDVVDQVTITGDNVKITGSTFYGNEHWANDPQHSDGTHDDNIQIQRGSNITISGNTLKDSHTAAVMVTQDMGKVANLSIANNSINHGACSINIAQKSYGPLSGVSIKGNTFGVNQQYAGCAISISGTTKAAISGNVFATGKAVTALFR